MWTHVVLQSPLVSRDARWDTIALGDASVAELSARGLPTPSYDRSALKPRIVHIGVGGFHRAHLAIYAHRLAERGSDWGICGIGLLPGDVAMAEALAAQDHLYTFTEKGTADDGTTTQSSAVIGSIIDYVFAADDPSLAADRIGAETTSIVSMTVTEAGYDDNDRNRTTFDVIAAGLDIRRAADVGGLTVMSCDNLPGNGAAARRRVLEACHRRDPDLAGWAERVCSFPNSMVDRITPVTVDEDRIHLLHDYGLHDRWPVVGEPFWQWVLEDEFAAGRPDFAAVGALYTDDVHAWELYKLRLLNAGHSAIAYLSALAGITYVDEALADPAIRHFLEQFLLTEAAPALDPIGGHPPEHYAATVVDRFANIGVRDQIARLCIDGTSKFPTFLMPTIASQLARGGPIERAALALAGWAHYLAEVPEAVQAHDSMGERSRPRAVAARTNPVEFLIDNPAFPDAVADDPRFREAFSAAHKAVAGEGPLGALHQLRST